MNLPTIKRKLSIGEIKANDVNPIIDSLNNNDLSKLTSDEANALKEMINNMLVLTKVPNSGARLNNPAKAESIIEQLALENT